MTATTEPAATDRRPRRGGNDRLRRLILAAIVAVAIGLFVLAGMLADTSGNDDIGVSGDVVERLTPGADTATFRQSPIAVDLVTGWSLQSLSLNGTAVPERDWDVTPELALYQYRPGDGKTHETLPGGETCVEAVIFRITDLTNTQRVGWCFTVN